MVIKAVSALQEKQVAYAHLPVTLISETRADVQVATSDGTPIVCIAAIAPGTEAAVVPELATGLILTAVGETHVEGMELADILQKIRATQRSREGELQLSFRRARTSTTDEPYADVRAPVQSEQEANGHPSESGGGKYYTRCI